MSNKYLEKVAEQKRRDTPLRATVGAGIGAAVGGAKVKSFRTESLVLHEDGKPTRFRSYKHEQTLKKGGRKGAAIGALIGGALGLSSYYHNKALDKK